MIQGADPTLAALYFPMNLEALGDLLVAKKLPQDISLLSKDPDHETKRTGKRNMFSSIFILNSGWKSTIFDRKSIGMVDVYMENHEFPSQDLRPLFAELPKAQF